jgi:hypothetical protein
MRTATRGAAMAVVLAALAGCRTADDKEPDPEPPKKPWPAEKAAKITYDPDSGEFTLKNVSPHSIEFWGEPKPDGSPGVYVTYERRLPTGTGKWVYTGDTIGGCKTGIQWVPLAPGGKVSLGGLPAKAAA